MIKVEVIRKIQSYTLGIGGIGTVDWEVLLECGHILKRTTESLTTIKFQTELQCNACEKIATHDLERFHTARAEGVKVNAHS